VKLVRYDGPYTVTFPFGPAIPGEVRTVTDDQLEYYTGLGFTEVQSEDEGWSRTPEPGEPESTPELSPTPEEIAIEEAARNAEAVEAAAREAEAAAAAEAERMAAEAVAVESAPAVDESDSSPSTIVTDTE